jgi:hypothetical protein
MADKPDPRFRAPNPTDAARRRAAIAAFIGDDPRFGVRIYDPNQPSAMDRARAAYAEQPESVSPAALNWLANLAQTDPKAVPKGIRNWLLDMVKNPMAAAMPKTGLAAVRAARAARLRDSEKMQAVNRFLSEKRTPFATGLEPPPLRSTPQKQYVFQREGFGPRVEVLDEIVGPPERITLEQARAAGVTGPEAMPLPPHRFTRQGPRVEIHE